MNEDLETRQPRTSTKAIVSLVLGILSLMGCTFLAGIPAIIVGLMARSEIKKDTTGTLEGGALAVAGIATGAVGTVFVLLISALMVAIAVPNFLEAQNRARISRTKSDLRTVAVALESYHIDHEAYPPTLHNLTSPVAYLSSVPYDPFTGKDSPQTYDYATDAEDHWILRGVGPDEDKDMVPLESYLDGDEPGEAGQKRLPYEYDPTNGTVSSGDIFRVGP